LLTLALICDCWVAFDVTTRGVTTLGVTTLGVTTLGVATRATGAGRATTAFCCAAWALLTHRTAAIAVMATDEATLAVDTPADEKRNSTSINVLSSPAVFSGLFIVEPGTPSYTLGVILSCAFGRHSTRCGLQGTD
jgi:hypothetical protein